MPEKDNRTLKFYNFYKQLPAPLVIYADSEAMTKKIQGYKPNNDESYTTPNQKHTDRGYGYKVVCHEELWPRKKFAACMLQRRYISVINVDNVYMRLLKSVDHKLKVYLIINN